MPDNDAVLLEEIRERRTLADLEWQEIKDEAKKDRLCVAGRPWDALDPKGKKQRMEAKRPYLALDELGQYLNQTVNDVRANPRGIKFAPTGNGANDQGAEFYQNHTREIEYRSHARVGYSTAFDNAVTSSYGWLRVRTKREHIRTFNQDIWIEPIANPDQVLPDPGIVWPDARDMKYLFYIEPWPLKEFERKFPKMSKGLSSEFRATAPSWSRPDVVDVAEYWTMKTVERQLVAFRKGPRGKITVSLVDELPGGKLPDGVENIREETVEDSTVCCYLTNGIEILKEHEWKGKHIPFVSCFGKTIYVDDGGGSKRNILSMTRLARDPYMLYCYYRTVEAELAAMTPKFPYFAYEGQLSPAELVNLQKSLHEPVAVVRVKPTVEGMAPNQVLQFPARQPYEPPFASVEVAAEAARRAIQAAMGISPLPTEAQRHNQKSGKALERIEASGQKGSFHFVDNYELMIERTGVLVEDLIDKIIDTARDVPVRMNDTDAAIVRVNDPSNPDSVSTKGDYRVTISTGPADASQREAADGFVDSMVSNIAVVAQIAGPQKAGQLLAKSVKLKQLGPIGDEIVELLEPPEPMGQDGKPLPPEAQALMQENQTLKSQLQQAVQTIQTDTHKEQVKIVGQKMLKEMDIAADERKSQRDSETKIAVAELGAKVDRLTLFAEERERLGLQMHEDVQAVKERLHEMNMAQAAHQQALDAADQAHQQALEQGNQGVVGQLAVQAAAPQPQAGAGA